MHILVKMNAGLICSSDGMTEDSGGAIPGPYQVN